MGPPGHNRSIRKQQRRDKGFTFPGKLTVPLEDDYLGSAGVAANPDLRVETCVIFFRALGKHNNPARMLPARFIRRENRLLLVTRPCDDHQGQDPAEGHHSALVTQGHDFLGNLGRDGVRKIYDHGRLQVLPSRSRSSSAEEGPQLPGVYFSGVASRPAQYSSKGSRIFQDSSTS